MCIYIQSQYISPYNNPITLTLQVRELRHGREPRSHNLEVAAQSFWPSLPGPWAFVLCVCVCFN